MTDWHYASGQQAKGPVSLQHLRHLLSLGRLGPDTMVWTQGMAQWQKASETALLAEPPPPGIAPAQSSLPPGPDSPSPDFRFAHNSIGPSGAELRIGRVLRHSAAIVRAHFRFWLLSGLIATLVLVAFAIILPSSISSAIHIVGAIVQAQLNATLTVAAFQACCRQDFSLREAFQKGSERFLAITGILTLMVLALFSGFIIAGIPGMLLGMLSVGLAVTVTAGASQSVVTFATIMFRSRGDSDLFSFIIPGPH
ncbi:MAG: DUF4339 domain-containing protein [Alphaproteobacteria bacterium]|nr:DUF4339 domain-containing protein [Alphaproteobacteria bacterium]